MTTRLPMPIPKGFQGAIRTLTKRKKLAAIREHGRKTEEEFFGPGGHFEDEAAAKRRTNPTRERYADFTWERIVKYLAQKGWRPLGTKGAASFGRHKGGFYQVLQLEAQAWRVLYSSVMTFAERSLGTYKDLDRALIAANRQANEYLGKKKNPITLVGNPPKPIRTWSRIGARVEGVLYNKILEIQAEKTGHHKHKGLWYHPFKKSSDVQLLALDTGDLLVHSKTGKKLWREDR